HVGEHYRYFQSLMRGHAGEVLWEAVQVPLRNTIEQALAAVYAEARPPAVPLAVMAQYLAGAVLQLLKWWLETEMPYTPEELDSMFRQMALPGVWATLEAKRV